MEAKGVAATAVTYSTAIAAMARGGDWAKALELLKSMAAKVGAKHTPNTPLPRLFRPHSGEEAGFQHH